MNIGKASKLSELTVKAVRYYDNIGLVKPHQNIDSGYREILTLYVGSNRLSRISS